MVLGVIISVPRAEKLFLLVLSILALESAHSIRFFYRHFLSGITKKSLNAFYYACSYAKVDCSGFMNVTAKIALHLIPESLKSQPVFIRFAGIEISYYEQKTFWSLCSYMVRSCKGIEMMINLINITYCGMKLLSYQDEKIKLQVSRIKRKDDQSFTDEIRLKWNQPEMADGYLIQKKEAGGKYTTCFNIKNSDICTTTISPPTISSYYGKDISFRIRAYSTGVDGKKSYTPYSYAEVSFWPKQPEITSLTKKTDRKLTVRWKKTAHTDEYEVWRSENGKPFTCVKRITNGKTQNFTDTGLKKGVTYTYAIKSYRINSLKKKIYGDIFTQTKLKTIKYS